MSVKIIMIKMLMMMVIGGSFSIEKSSVRVSFFSLSLSHTMVLFFVYFLRKLNLLYSVGVLELFVFHYLI